MTVIVLPRGYAQHVYAVPVQPFCAAFRHEIIRVVTEKTYHSAVRAVRIFIICAIKAVFFWFEE